MDSIFSYYDNLSHDSQKEIEIILGYALFLGILQSLFNLLVQTRESADGVSKSGIIMDIRPADANTPLSAFVNRIISSTHAVILFSLSLYFWVSNPSAIINPPPETTPPLVKASIDLMLGYLIYDTLADTIWNVTYDVTLHHFLGFLSLGYIRYINCAQGAHYQMIVFLAEASTPALHSSWVMDKLKLTSTPEFQIIGWTLVFLFFTFRIVLGPLLAIKMYVERSVWDGLEDFLFPANFLIVLIFTGINYMWFYKLIRLAMKKSTYITKAEDLLIGEDDPDAKTSGDNKNGEDTKVPVLNDKKNI